MIFYFLFFLFLKWPQNWEKGRLKDRFESFETRNTFSPQEHLPQVDKAPFNMASPCDAGGGGAPIWRMAPKHAAPSSPGVRRPRPTTQATGARPQTASAEESPTLWRRNLCEEPFSF